MPFWIPSATKRLVRILAAELGLTQQQVMLAALHDYLKKHGKEPADGDITR